MIRCLVDAPPQTSTLSSDSEYTLVKPFGSCSDSACYEEEEKQFIDAVFTLELEFGDDPPESQTVALVRAAEEWSWRDGVLKVTHLLCA